MARGHEQRSADMTVIDTEINWGFNCLTAGIHHGRPEILWNIPLNYAVIIFRRHILKSLVVARIYNDAMQFVEHRSEEDPELSNVTHRFAPEWADRIKEIAEEKYDHTLQQKVGEISRYYKSSGWESDQENVARLVIKNKLNPGYEPLHGHDTINLLCRMIGVSASLQASKELYPE